MSQDRCFALECVFTGQKTDMAMKVVSQLTGEELWFPHSQIESIHGDNGKNSEGTVVVTEWVAKKKGLL